MRPRRLSVPSFLLLLLIANIAPPLTAQPSAPTPLDPLYTLEDPSVPAPASLDGAAGSHAIQLDPQVLAGNPDRLRLDLPDGRTAEARRLRFADRGPERRYWTGEIVVPATADQAAERGVAHLVARGDRVVGVINLGHLGYRIDHESGIGHRLIRASTPASHSCGIDTATLHASGARPLDLSIPAPKAADLDFKTLESTPTQIDLVVLYSDEFLGSSQSITDVEDFVELSVMIANDVFADSQINAVYELAYVGPLTGEQPPSREILGARNWMSEGQAEIELIRDTYGGDMVALVVPATWAPNSVCGVATLPLANGCDCEAGGASSSTPFAQRAFSVHKLDCEVNAYTFAHELGHNFGMWHDQVDCSPTVYSPNVLVEPFAQGYLFETASLASSEEKGATTHRATVMGCAFERNQFGQCVREPLCGRVGLFSDPSLTFTPGSGVPPVAVGDQNAWNAEVARRQKLAYSQFRSSTTNGVPTIQIQQPARDTLVQTGSPLIFRATASDPEQGNLTSAIRWRSNLSGSLGTGGVISPILSQGNHIVTASVTDNADQTVEWSVPVVSDPAPVARFTYSCDHLVCSFDGRSSTDNGPLGPFRLSWNFGDSGIAIGEQVNHTYAQAGTYSVTLTVTDNVGWIDTETKTITVTAPPPPPPPPSCSPSTTKLCLQGNRFEVQVAFTNGGSTQAARTRTFSNQSGFFYFFNSSNLEVAVKVLDARTINGKWWVFHGAMTSLRYTVTVRDTVNGTTQTYVRPATTGSVQCGGADTGSFSALSTLPADLDEALVPALSFDAEDLEVRPGVTEAGSCTPGAGRICLLNNRFQVRVLKSGSYKNGATLTTNSGTFWFGSSSNTEVSIKILDGTSVNGKYWVFFGSQTNQSYQVIVTDTVTGAVKSWTAPAAHCGIADTAAF